MTEFQRFGSPDLFEIAARWTTDDEPRDRLPEDGGWSTGDLRLTVRHQVLTARSLGGEERGHVSWYLYPLVKWLIAHWTRLFHEEAYSWPDRSGAPAATATHAALLRTIASGDPDQRREYQEVQAWWMRHALRASDSSALYPDVFFRRVADDIEVSWGGRQPDFVPEGFVLTLSPGYASFAVEVVARPLWQFVEWALETAPAEAGTDARVVDDLKKTFRGLKQAPLQALELAHLTDRLRGLLSAARRAVELPDTSTRLKDVPAIASLDAAVLMFGGLHPSIGEIDAVRLMEFLAKHQAGIEPASLARLVECRPLDPSMAPYQEGYDLAENVREELGIGSSESFVNVQRSLRDLGIGVEEARLQTDSVRGVAVAGAGFAPAILINTSSAFNRTHEGRRFTMAHELCHILFDRSRAKRLSHVSGSWTSARVEKRANAFAAMFLASRAATRSSFNGANAEAIQQQARALAIGSSALVEHLYNLELIDESDRERLRAL